MSEKFNRKSFFQRVVGGLATLTLAKTEAKPVLNQTPIITIPPVTPSSPRSNYGLSGVYSGMFITGSCSFSGSYLAPYDSFRK